MEQHDKEEYYKLFELNRMFEQSIATLKGFKCFILEDHLHNTAVRLLKSYGDYSLFSYPYKQLEYDGIPVFKHSEVLLVKEM